MGQTKVRCRVIYKVGTEKDFKEFQESPIRVGRSDDMDLQIKDTRLSRVHLVIHFDENTVTCIDQGSSNGTYLNGKRIASKEVIKVLKQDRLHIGSKDIEINIEHEVVEEKTKSQVETISQLKTQDSPPIHNPLIQLEAREKELKYQIQQLNQDIEHIQIKKNKYIDNLKKYDTAFVQAKEKFSELESLFESQKQKLDQEIKKIHDKLLDEKTNLKNILAEKSEAIRSTQEIVKRANEESEKLKSEALQYVEKERARLNKEHSEKYKEIEDWRKSQELDWRAEYKRRVEVLESELLSLKVIADSDIERQKLEAQKSIAEKLRQAEDEAQKVLNSAREEVGLQKAKSEADLQSYILQARDEFEKELSSERERLSFEFQEKNEELLQKSQEILAKAEAQVKDTLDKANKSADEVRQQAKKQADRMVFEANAKVQTIQFEIEAHHRDRQEIQEKLTQSRLEFEELCADLDLVRQDLKNTEEILKEKKSEKSEVSVALEDLRVEYYDKDSNLKGIEKQIDNLKKELQGISNDYTDKLSAYKTLESNYKLLDQEYQLIKNQKKSEVDSWFAAEKKKIDDAIIKYQEDKNHHLKLEFQKQVADMLAKKEVIATSLSNYLSQKILLEFKPYMPNSYSWQGLQEKVKSDISSKLIQEMASFGAEKFDSTSTLQTLRRTRSAWSAHAITVTLTLAFLMLVPQVRDGAFNFIQSLSWSEGAKIQKAEMASERARRYQPLQKKQYGKSYVDSVLYSLDYSRQKLNEKLREDWILYLNENMFKKRLISDENIIKVVSLEAALIKKLDEEAQQIHPDFVNDSISKMKRIEKDIKKEIHMLLGSTKNIKEYEVLSEKFYYQNVSK